MQDSLVEIPQASLAGPDDLIVLRNILVATDLSECSTRALRHALGIAGRYGSRLHLFHCIDPAPYDLADPAEVTRACEDVRKELKQTVAGLRSQTAAKDIEINTVVAPGKLASLLSETVSENKIDLIVVGMHGRTGWKKAFLGSVAETVIDQSACPVLVVGRGVDRTRIQDFGPESILLAGDASIRSQPADSYAISLARKYDSRLNIVDMVEDEGGVILAQVSQLKWSERKVKNTTLDTGVVPHQMLINADVQSDLILQVADQTAADLIVLAVPSTHKFRDRFVSTNSYRVVCGARCPVLTVRAQ